MQEVLSQLVCVTLSILRKASQAHEGDRQPLDKSCMELVAWCPVGAQSMFVEILNSQEYREMTKNEASEKANC